MRAVQAVFAMLAAVATRSWSPADAVEALSAIDQRTESEMRPPPKTYDFWVKVVEMLQQNWATIEGDETGARILFVADTSEIIDEMAFPSKTEAVAGLIYNGFRRFADAPDLQDFLRAPEPPFVDGQFTNDIYSSGRFWRDAPI